MMSSKSSQVIPAPSTVQGELSEVDKDDAEVIQKLITVLPHTQLQPLLSIVLLYFIL